MVEDKNVPYGIPPAMSREEMTQVVTAGINAAVSWGVTSDPDSPKRNVERAMKRARQRIETEHEKATGLVALMKPPAYGVAMVRRVKKKGDSCYLSAEEEILLRSYVQYDDFTYVTETVDGHILVGKLVAKSREDVLKTKVLFQMAETIPVEGGVMDNLIAGFYRNEEGEVDFYDYTFPNGDLIVKQCCLNLDARANNLFMVEAGNQCFDGHVTTFVQVIE